MTDLQSCIWQSKHPGPLVPAKAGTQGHGPRPLDSRLRGNERSLSARAECLIVND